VRARIRARGCDGSGPASRPGTEASPDRRTIALDDIRDEKSTTLLVLETANSGINWMEPRDFVIDQPELMPCPTHKLTSRSRYGGAGIGLADGGVRFVPHTDYPGYNNQILRALATIDGEEEVDRYGW
jgi:hypothetical protein